MRLLGLIGIIVRFIGFRGCVEFRVERVEALPTAAKAHPLAMHEPRKLLPHAAVKATVGDHAMDEHGVDLISPITPATIMNPINLINPINTTYPINPYMRSRSA